MKIFCIGRNYQEHALELNNPVPEEPLVFMKPKTALLEFNKPFYHPEFSSNIHYEVEIVLKVSKNGRHIAEPYARSFYEEIGLGIDFTARDIQDKCKAKGHPWEKAKAFDHSAAISKFIDVPVDMTDGIQFSLYKNDVKVQDGTTLDLIFSFDHLIAHLSTYFTLNRGDLIYTGTPKGVGKVEIGDRLTGYIGERLMFDFEVK